MSNPMVIAYHLIWTAYGWWLPNDPRGSGSDRIRTDVLAELGGLHKGRKKVQPSGKTVREFYEKAAEALKYPLLTFDESCRAIIADAFAEVIECEHYTCYACAIMPDHVHMVIRKHKHTAEDRIENLMNSSRQGLILDGKRTPDHPTWTAGVGWNVFLDPPVEVRWTIGYVERNPGKDNLPAQNWPFVKVYDNWPLHQGHSPNSPWARRLARAGRYPQ